jgi:hypothetical protein
MQGMLAARYGGSGRATSRRACERNQLMLACHRWHSALHSIDIVLACHRWHSALHSIDIVLAYPHKHTALFSIDLAFRADSSRTQHS